MRTHLPSPGRCGAVLVATLLAAACTDDPAALTSRPPVGPRPAVSVASRPQLIPNSVLYRDTGHHAASARSGSAQLMLRALLDIKGVTTVEVTTGSFDASPGPGSITKLQVKGLAPNDSLLFTLNNNGLTGGFASLRTRGLTRGFLVQAQANVGGIDGTRIDVVTVRDTVLPRPDLIVQSLQLPLAAPIGIPVPIAAVVREGKGAFGARATCRLYVDGAPADSAPRIWVDAGGIVSCGFAHAFPAAGTYHLEVRVEDVTPGDYDESSNSRGATLEVGPNSFAYYAWREWQANISWSHYSGFWARLDAPEGNYYDIQSGDTSVYDNAAMSASMPRTLSFPLARIRLAQRSGLTTIQDTTLYAVVPDYPAHPDPDSAFSCVVRSGTGWYFSLCSGIEAGAPSTFLAYGRWAGQVTYYSAGFSGWWSWSEGGFYSWNSSWADPPIGLPGPGGDPYEFLVALTDGASVWLTNPKILSQASTVYTWQPPTCDQPVPDSTALPYIYSYCSESLFQQSMLSGVAQGVPEPVTPVP